MKVVQGHHLEVQVEKELWREARLRVKRVVVQRQLSEEAWIPLGLERVYMGKQVR